MFFCLRSVGQDAERRKCFFVHNVDLLSYFRFMHFLLAFSGIKRYNNTVLKRGGM